MIYNIIVMKNSTLKLSDILDDENSISIDYADKFVSSHNLVLLSSMMLHEPGTKIINLNVQRQKGTTSALCQTAVLSCISMPDVTVLYHSGLSYMTYRLLRDYCYDIIKDIKIEFDIDVTFDSAHNTILFSNGSKLRFVNNNSDFVGVSCQMMIFDNFSFDGKMTPVYEKLDKFYIVHPGGTGARCIIYVNQTENNNI